MFLISNDINRDRNGNFSTKCLAFVDTYKSAPGQSTSAFMSHFN